MNYDFARELLESFHELGESQVNYVIARQMEIMIKMLELEEADYGRGVKLKGEPVHRSKKGFLGSEGESDLRETAGYRQYEKGNVLFAIYHLPNDPKPKYNEYGDLELDITIARIDTDAYLSDVVSFRSFVRNNDGWQIEYDFSKKTKDGGFVSVHTRDHYDGYVVEYYDKDGYKALIDGEEGVVPDARATHASEGIGEFLQSGEEYIIAYAQKQNQMAPQK